MLAYSFQHWMMKLSCNQHWTGEAAGWLEADRLQKIANIPWLSGVRSVKSVSRKAAEKYASKFSTRL